jgi:transposase-like protein
MTCRNCRIEARRFGKHRDGLQRFRCTQCGKTFTEARKELIPRDASVLGHTLCSAGDLSHSRR